MLRKTIIEGLHFLVKHQTKPISIRTLSFSGALTKNARNPELDPLINPISSINNRTNCRFLTTNRQSPNLVSTTLDAKFKMEWPKITLFGDSITRRSMDPDNGCWGSMIAHRVGSFMEVDVRGFEGYNSGWTLELMPKLFPKSYLDKVQIFIPFFGHNDAWKNYPLHLPVDQFETNTRAMIKYLNDNDVENKKIILITPTWYHAENFNIYMKSLGFPPTSKEFEDAQKYADAIDRIGKETGIDVVDFFTISANYKPLEEMFCDGVHYSRKGARLLFDCLMPIIERKIEDSYKKPLADLWHVTPIEKHPIVIAAIEAYHKAQKGE